MSAYEDLKQRLLSSPRVWLITGVGGFIGSNLLEQLLKLNQTVVGLDNFSTGSKSNLEQVRALVGEKAWQNFRLVEGDIADPDACQEACRGVDYVLHQAALGSVPRSMVEPVATHESNVTGFLNMLLAARDHKVKRFVFASSSAIYGNNPDLPKVEDKIGQPLSPYAATKSINEVYAASFAHAYGFQSVGLRYFNVFGPRQDPEGAYAAVIPKWIAALLHNEPVRINGDGETSRDFCYIDNVVQANLLAATVQSADAVNQFYNVAVGGTTTLNELFQMLQDGLRKRDPKLPAQKPVYGEFRAGDIRASLADISKVQRLLGYEPRYKIHEGIELALDWYKANAERTI